MKRLPLDADYLVREYEAGAVLSTLARKLGVSLDAVKRRLTVHVRNQSEAEALKWERMTDEQKARQVSAAHEAARGRVFRPEEHMVRAPHRFRYLLDQGWRIVVVWIETRRHPLTAAATDYVVAYIEQSRRDPAAIREYRVIRGTGELVASGRADDDEIAIVPALTARRDATSGRYTSVPG